MGRLGYLDQKRTHHSRDGAPQFAYCTGKPSETNRKGTNLDTECLSLSGKPCQFIASFVLEDVPLVFSRAKRMWDLSGGRPGVIKCVRHSFDCNHGLIALLEDTKGGRRVVKRYKRSV
jgi:hypothetical protein